MADAVIIPLRPYGNCLRCLKPLGEDYHADEDDRRYCPDCCPDCDWLTHDNDEEGA